MRDLKSAKHLTNFNSLSYFAPRVRGRTCVCVCVCIAQNNKIKANKTKVNLPFYCFGYRLCAVCADRCAFYCLVFLIMPCLYLFVALEHPKSLVCKYEERRKTQKDNRLGKRIQNDESEIEQGEVNRQEVHMRKR